MKTIYLVVALSFTVLSSLFAQSEGINSKEAVWYGLDFTKAKMIGSEGFTSPEDVKSKMFIAWNHMVLTEPEKYDIKKAFKKDKVEIDLSLVEKRNQTVNADELVINEDYSFDKSVVEGIVKSYKTAQKEGLGIVFVVESFSKIKEEGSIYVTFFDIASKNVLLTEKVTGKAGGFGLKNYWAKVFHNVLKTSEGKMKSWTKK